MSGLSTLYAVLAPPLQRTTISAPPRSGCTVTVTAAMTSRSKRLRSTGRRGVGVPERRQIRGQPAHLLDFDLIERTQLGLTQALVLFLQARRPQPVPLSQRCSSSRATKRLSGSTASYCRCASRAS